MTTLASVEAKSHFSEMIERASQGEEIIITKRGLPVVRVVPYEKTSADKIEAFLSQAKEFRSGLTSQGVALEEGESWSELAHEGHKW